LCLPFFVFGDECCVAMYTSRQTRKSRLNSMGSMYLERTVMKVPIETKPALWGVAIGAVALAIVGFSWGGWTTGGKAESAALTRANEAVVGALAPVCVDKFQRAGDAPANLAALKKVDTWSQGDFVEKGGWAAVPGTHSTERVSAVAKACAGLLTPA
jgi:hypothetical protein